ncbi:MAG: beta-ketoacyl synthase chain length factor [Pseudomonadota bacterium]
MIQFNIDQWRAWAPGIECPQDWARWSLAPWIPAESEAQPDVTFLAALQRRRLSRLARMAFSVAWPLAEGQPPQPLVFVSRHGETPRTFAILGDLANREPLSPTQFSLSVHNAVIGLWSILRGDTSEMTALAGEGDGLEHGLLEAALLLADGAPSVLLVVTEDSPPPAYAPWILDVPFPYALALRLTTGRDWQLDLGQAEGEHPAAAEWPHALSLLQLLAGPLTHCQHHWKQRLWTWQHHR